MSSTTGFAGSRKQDVVESALRQRNIQVNGYLTDELSSPGSQQNDVDTNDKETGVPNEHFIPSKLESYIMPIIFTILAFYIRMYKIGVNKHVVWDEAHFGSFGSQYLKHEFYHDVHPPLGKMLVGLSGYISGYNGSFSFDSGVPYPDYVDFVKMRLFNATFSALCVPIAYFTAKSIGFSIPATWFLTTLVLFENSYTTLGKFILLDSMLLFFTVISFFCFVKFHNERLNPFSINWWKWMVLTGFNLGCAISVKMVGLFIITVVGIYTVVELWSWLGDKTMSWKTYLSHWMARIIGLIIVPIAVFMTAFYVHFMLLTHDGQGSGVMPSLFQASLINSTIGQGPRDVAVGSYITLKNSGIGGALLHSHPSLYPEGSKQQQITGYAHHDSNNDWFFDRVRELPPFDFNSEGYDPEYITNGMTYRLVHNNTGRNLHSHGIPAPMTNIAWEVSGYGNTTIGDDKDYWMVEIVDQYGSENKSIVHPLTTSFRLRNIVMNCYLAQSKHNLPEWGFTQREIICARNPSKNDRSTWWTIESHTNDKLPPKPKDFKFPSIGFLQKFIHLNLAMMASNNALVPDDDKYDPIASSAWQWPTLYLGLRICSWADEFPKYFLMGTPVSTWASTVSVILFTIYVVILLLRWQRQYTDLSGEKDWNLFLMGGFYPLLAWSTHYVPFVIMSRVTYVHHYLPALYFALIILTYVFEATLNRLATKRYIVRWIVYLIAMACVISCFIYFAPISYGMTGPAINYKYLRWIKTWNIYN